MLCAVNVSEQTVTLERGDLVGRARMARAEPDLEGEGRSGAGEVPGGETPPGACEGGDRFAHILQDSEELERMFEAGMPTCFVQLQTCT